MKLASVSIIGGGAWGTALAQTLALGGQRVTLWAREPEVVADIATRRVNRAFLPGVELDHNITATGDLADATACDAILIVAPAQHVRSTTAAMARTLRPDTPVVMCAKGIEQATGKLMGDVIAETLPAAQFAVLSGPSFAADVARGLPAALTLACRNEQAGRGLAAALSSRQMRLYWSSDVVGAELGGAVKNVLAIAAGIVEGRGLGASAHAAIVTRGFAELQPFRRRDGRAARHAARAFGPRRSDFDVRQSAVAQHVARARSWRRQNAGGHPRQPHGGDGRRVSPPQRWSSSRVRNPSKCR